ncbi:hypothetical protein ACFLXU_06220 [Chloroflexota bacterium]
MTARRKSPVENSTLQDLIPTLDIDTVGIARLSEFKGTKLEETALRLLPQAQSVVVCAMEIFPEILNHTRPERTMGEASLNDLMDSNTDFLNGRLTEAAYDVARASRNMGFKALPLPALGCPFDARFLDSVFSYKHAAQAAGLGYLGRSSLLLTPNFGPRVRLSCCLTEALLEPTVKADMVNVCQHCKACINGCPSGAIIMPEGEEPYMINKFACSTYRSAAGGCSECMRVCPAADKR